MKGEITAHGFDPRHYQRDLLDAWESFVDTGALDSDLVPEFVAESWQRAQNRKIDPFHIPPSAYLDPIAYGKRKEEIRELVPLFIGQMGNVFNKVIDDVAEDYYEAFLGYNWPGNIRELRNAVKYSLTFLDGTVLRARHLAGFFTSGPPALRKADHLWFEMPVTNVRLSAVEAVAIRKSLDVARGNKAAAAKLLGIGRATLYRKLKDLS